MEVLFVMCPVVYIAIVMDFLYFLVKGRRDAVLSSPLWAVVSMIAIVLLLCLDRLSTNECCGTWSLLAPKHRLSVYVLISMCTAAYFYCEFRGRTAPPLLEVAVNCLLISGVALIVFMCIQEETRVAIYILIPYFLLLMMRLTSNHRQLMKEMLQRDEQPLYGNWAARTAWRLLQMPVATRVPILLILCIPVLMILSTVLLLFGQQPDALVRAFTDTYRHGLSQLDMDCNKVVCGGHFLCTIAAKGHRGLVKPVRVGVRAGGPIQCNRQLLIANAFEEWLEQHVPRLHRPVRRLYNHVGSYLHRHYDVFDRKWVSDAVYVLMKPLEWMFLLTLYVGDRHPENRIAQQYMHRGDRERIKLLSK